VGAFSVPNLWNGSTLWIAGTGPYALLGLYAGSYFVMASGGPFGEICYGDPTCSAPTILTLSNGQILTGIDLTFSTSEVAPESWGSIKTLYRKP
jgi:hypothetical protein